MIAGRWWLVGASEGLGRALAQALSAEGAELVLSARNAERLQDLAAALPGPATVVPCDVRDQASVETAAQAAGAVDGVIWMAGTYWPMRAQDWDTARIESMIDVNLTGAARVLGQVLPGMVARGAGRIVIVGSLAGIRGLPGAVGYGASKAGLMSLAETLSADLRGTGVRVQLVNPGFVKTRLTAQNDFPMPFLMEPEDAARRICRHIEKGGFMADFPALFAAFFRLGRVLPQALWLRLVGGGSG